MQVEAITAAHATLTFTEDEVRLVNNALNEALEALASNPSDLETRTGASVAAVTELLAAVHAVVLRMRP